MVWLKHGETVADALVQTNLLRTFGASNASISQKWNPNISTCFRKFLKTKNGNFWKQR